MPGVARLLLSVCLFGVFPLAAAVAQTLLPPQLPSTVELFNPMSGFSTLLVQTTADLEFQAINPKYVDAAPLHGLPLNEYGRLSWHSVEPSEGHYDFSIIGHVLERCPAPAGQTLCLPRGVTFGFRIMALNPQVKSDTNVTTGADGYPVYSDLPVYLETGKHGWLLPVDPKDATQGHYFIPDWNDPYFLGRARALLSALGRRYNGDRRIGWLDIGIYGSWGEWHTAGLPDAADYTRGIPYASTDPYYALNTQAYLQNTGKPGAYQAGTAAAKSFIVDSYAAAFANTQLVMLTDDGEGLCHALKLPGDTAHVGLRRDSLGSGSDWTYQFPTQLPNCDTPADQKLILDRWKTAPFVAEPYGNGSSPTFPCQTFETDPGTGLYNINEQVPQFHIATIKNGSLCTGTWSDLSTGEQQSWLTAGLQAGYRLAPVEVHVAVLPDADGRPSLAVQTRWANTGATPAYDDWNVEFSLRRADGLATWVPDAWRFISHVDLRKILPTGTTPVVVQDRFALPEDMAPGRYELRIRVVDPRRYMQPMQLALQRAMPRGYYPLGMVEIPALRRP